MRERERGNVRGRATVSAIEVDLTVEVELPAADLPTCHRGEGCRERQEGGGIHI